MVNSDELLYVVDEFDSPLTPAPRHIVFKKGLYRRTVHVWIQTEDGKILCQQRSLVKDISPGKWEPQVGGHIGPGENYFTGAIREVYEETGIELKLSDLKLLKIYKEESFKEYRGVFFCKLPLKIRDVKKEEEEVSDIKLVHARNLKKLLLYNKSKKWIRYGYEKEIFSVITN